MFELKRLKLFRFSWQTCVLSVIWCFGYQNVKIQKYALKINFWSGCWLQLCFRSKMHIMSLKCS